MSVAKTLHQLQTNFFWPQMHYDVRWYVAQCSVCQQTKYRSKKPSGDAILPPKDIRAYIIGSTSNLTHSILFVEGFITGFHYWITPSNDFTSILVVVDSYSKGTHFGALPPCYTGHKVVVLFLDMVCKLHEFPQSLVSDRNLLFICKLHQTVQAVLWSIFNWGTCWPYGSPPSIACES